MSGSLNYSLCTRQPAVKTVSVKSVMEKLGNKAPLASVHEPLPLPFVQTALALSNFGGCGSEEGAPWSGHGLR